MAMNNEEYVVKEMDVYLSKALAKQLHIFQYLIRPSSATYDEVKVLQAKVKPKQEKIELEVALNTNSPSYNYSKGEQIAINVDGQNPGRDAHFQGGIMNKQVLTSTKTPCNVSQYAVGYIKDSNLHLTPVQSVVHLLPSFQYLDQSDVRAKANKQDKDVDDPPQEEEELKAVTVRFAGQNTERAKRARERSYKYLEQQRASEQWINVNFNHIESNMSAMEKVKLTCSQTGHYNSPFTNTTKQYLNILTADSTNDRYMETKVNSCQSVNHIRTLCVPDQVRALMSSAKVLRFRQLSEILPSNSDPNAVVRSLQQVSVLVQGCWVVKSDVIFPKDSFSPITGVPADILCRARDYIMWLFTRSETLMQHDILSTVKLPLEDLKDIMHQMGRPTGNRGWRFLYPYDSEFVRRFPDVVKRQEMLWDARSQQLMKMLQFGQDAKKATDADGKHPLGKTVQRRRKKSWRDSTSDDAESGTETASLDKAAKSSRKTSSAKFVGLMDVDAVVPNASALCKNGNAKLQPEPMDTDCLESPKAKDRLVSEKYAEQHRYHS